MSLPVWCAELAAAFWARAGHLPAFPRNLRSVVSGAVPLAVIDLADLRVTAVSRWFARMGLSLPLDVPDRPLRACLVAWLGEGFVFLDRSDEPAERGFSLAHELGHFLRDYWHPRQTVLRRLGPAALDVLDGRRLPTAEERLHAILRNVSIGPLTHLLRRDESGQPPSPTERESEAAADRLAFELLAPVAAIGEAGNRTELVDRLVARFGLPIGPATRYAALLVPEPVRNDRLVARLLGS